MSTLVVVAYPTQYKAEEVRLQLLKMQKDYLVDLEDAAIAVKQDNGKVKLHQLYSLTGAGAVSGGFWGLLIGLIFLNPLLGAAVGAGAGAVSGALSDVGINDAFMKDLADQMQPGHSVLFVLFRSLTLDKALDELRGTGGTVIQTSLSHEDESRLRAALDSRTLPGVADMGAGASGARQAGAGQFVLDPRATPAESLRQSEAAREQAADMAGMPYDAPAARPLEDPLPRQKI
ncbi:MAG: DUF1269 domain-containing protein [Desulfovibrionaceae bacterium]|nr:DUF1269 domain-containing protein [Desulfovibrionaceae bacterium]